MKRENAHRLDGYETYPLSLSPGEPSLQYLHSELERRSPSLFATKSSECNLEVLEAIYKPNACHVASMELTESAENLQINGPTKPLVSFLSTLVELEETLKNELPPCSVRLLLLHRSNSWSRIKITLEMFKAICNFDRVTPRFLSIIFGLGRKTASFDENFMTCYRNFSIRPEKKGKGMKYEDGYMCEDQSRQNLYESYDICYNIRHFELHRRDLDDPWSCRQSAIHQKYYFANGHSKWMIVHPPTLFGESLKDTDFGKIAHPLGLHLRYLAAGAANWREYLNLISEKLTDLDRKVSFPKSLKDFDVDFSFGQQVHVLSRKLSHAHLILENTLDTISSLKLFADKVTQMTNSSRSVVDSFQSELQDISSELRSYLLTSRKLLDFSEDIKLMNNDILRFRDQELLYENGIKLAQIAQSNALVNKIMVMLATNTAGDSRTMRIATIVALFYLPASFTMTFFSSSLVEINVASNSRKGDKGAPGMYVHHEIWVAILTILVLASLTFLPAIYWDRRGKRRTNTVTFGA